MSATIVHTLSVEPRDRGCGTGKTRAYPPATRQDKQRDREMKMYYATVGFTVDSISATDFDNVQEQLNNLIDQLATVETDLHWDEVDWVITEDTREEV